MHTTIHKFIINKQFCIHKIPFHKYNKIFGIIAQIQVLCPYIFIMQITKHTNKLQNKAAHNKIHRIAKTANGKT